MFMFYDAEAEGETIKKKLASEKQPHANNKTSKSAHEMTRNEHMVARCFCNARLFHLRASEKNMRCANRACSGYVRMFSIILT